MVFFRDNSRNHFQDNSHLADKYMLMLSSFSQPALSQQKFRVKEFFYFYMSLSFRFKVINFLKTLWFLSVFTYPPHQTKATPRYFLEISFSPYRILCGIFNKNKICHVRFIFKFYYLFLILFGVALVFVAGHRSLVAVSRDSSSLWFMVLD